VTFASGSPAYVAAHHIAVVEERLPFAEAYCLSRLVFEHSGGPVIPGKEGPVSLQLCKRLALKELVQFTNEVSDSSANARLSIAPGLLAQLGDRPQPVRRSDRRRTMWPVEVTQLGLDLVAAAFGTPTDPPTAD
jgi:hypothetical protein